MGTCAGGVSGVAHTQARTLTPIHTPTHLQLLLERLPQQQGAALERLSGDPRQQLAFLRALAAAEQALAGRVRVIGVMWVWD